MKQTGQAGPLGQAGQPKLRRMLILMFAAYALFMLYLLLVRNRGGLPADPAAWRREQFNLIPFRSVREYLTDLFGTDPVKTRAAVVNLGGNIFLFVPFGFLLPVLFARFRSPSRVLLLMAAVMTAVEILQLLTCRGHCDLDDLILNLIGVAAGVFLYSAITRIRNKKKRRHQYEILSTGNPILHPARLFRSDHCCPGGCRRYSTGPDLFR